MRKIDLNNSRKLVGPLVSAAVTIIAVTNFCLFRILDVHRSPREAFALIWPMAVPATVTVILVMSALYQLLEEAFGQLEERRSEMADKAQRDSLTGLASRELFNERLSQALARNRRTRERFAVIMLDLDHFKRVNDLHGHQNGDELLKQASQRLQSLVRATDTVARFGGDEFLILQSELPRPSEVRRLCERICAGLHLPYEIGTLRLQLATSIGAVVASKELVSPDDYVRAADMALYEAKRSGRGCFRFFSPELDEQLRRRDRLERDLRHALLARSDVAVHYQPQIDSSGKLAGVEALFRWSHPVLGNIPACEAIEIAEESDLIDLLGDFVFREAAAIARRYPHLSVAVNLSPAQFSRSDNLSAQMRELARQERVAPGQIEFEITERLFMQADSGSDSQVQALRDLGFRVALDDFGTGYSSLSYLRRFKVDRLKLDKSFIAHGDLEENISVIRAAVSLAHMLGLDVIAEGVETEAQEAVALESGCDALQGHRYGLPMPAEQFSSYMEEAARKAA
ncbi:MAG: putative bifunctional diguanylate cyclase/phosphodiesterase [Sphingomicrobium sp.]